MKSRLLAHIAFKFTSHPENVANECLCFILNQDPMAVQKLCSAISKSEMASDICEFRSELSTEQNGRPDISAIGKSGDIPFIIEGKFWASLTENQPHNYLKELKDGGVLLFVCPEMRASRLKDELEVRTGEKFEYIHSSYFMAVCGNKTIYIMDWIKVLSAIDAYASANDSDLSNDIKQLTALCSQMDSEGFLPLSLGDMNEYHGRLCDKLSLVIDSLRERLRNKDYMDFSGLKAGGWRLGYGVYATVHGYGCQIYFSASAWYRHDVKTPYWIGIESPDWKPDRSIYDKFNAIDKYNGTILFDGSFVQIPLPLKCGLDEEQLLDHLAKQIDDIAIILATLKNVSINGSTGFSV